ncbi:hypothetical protein C8Q80DRAFT_345519 [Daedaleopsis nitida]|nr:hypothetical protein C8Q80DRAFT_345519 [Daedaleopsis nitida]
MASAFMTVHGLYKKLVGATLCPWTWKRASRHLGITDNISRVRLAPELFVRATHLYAQHHTSPIINMGETHTSSFHDIVTATGEASLTQYLEDNSAYAFAFADGLEGGWLTMTLSTMLFGVLTICTTGAGFVLIRKNLRQLSSILLFAALVGMYVSTCLSWVLAYRREHLATSEAAAAARNVYTALLCVRANSRDPLLCAQQNENLDALDAFSRHDTLQDCAATAALTVNVVLGDAIVWWRAWVIWQGNRIVRALCIILLICTFALGVADTSQSCTQAHGFSAALAAANTGLTFPVGTLFQGDATGIATCVLSLVTNFAATAVIGYKAWQHRRLIAKHLRLRSRRSQVERVLALIVESGVIYCIIWIFVVAYQFAVTRFHLSAASTHHITDHVSIHVNASSAPIVHANASTSAGAARDAMNAFTRRTDTSADLSNVPFVHGFEFFVEGCLVFAIAIYPTIIILIVALNKSYYDDGGIGLGLGAGNTGDLPLPISVGRQSLVFQQQTTGVRSELHSGSEERATEDRLGSRLGSEKELDLIEDGSDAKSGMESVHDTDSSYGDRKTGELERRSSCVGL